MKYISDLEFQSIHIDWNLLIQEIYAAAKIYSEGDFCQPLKPYLRYNNPENRIIAMPAYIGGDIKVAGIKWISSFPNNIDRNIRRAHSVVILNEEDTGIPYAIINSPSLSSVRTASVSGAIVNHYLKYKNSNKSFNVGIIGFGPVGQTHLQMFEALFKKRISKYIFFDLEPSVFENIPLQLRNKVILAKSWEEVYQTADIFCTCTVSKSSYIHGKPKEESLHLNVSLRDYQESFLDYSDIIIVDDWNEVCRENTNIEKMYLNKGLKKEDTISMADFLLSSNIALKNKVVMFNPMGLAIFDMTIAKQFYRKANTENLGVNL